MTTYREAIYMCLDLIKGNSDDFSYSEEHVAYLLDKFRALLLKQRYGNNRKKEIPYSNYQTISIKLELSTFEGNKYYICNPIDGTTIPYTLQIGIPRISVASDSYGDINLEYISRERLPFVGNNKYLKNFWYCSLDEQNRLLLKTSSVRIFEDKEALNEEDIPTLTFRITALFENPRELSNEITFKEGTDELDRNIPIEESLITTLIEMVAKELLGAAYRPADTINNSNDDMASMANFLANNMKKDFNEQIRS
jgi:hypothetical protein